MVFVEESFMLAMSIMEDAHSSPFICFPMHLLVSSKVFLCIIIYW